MRKPPLLVVDQESQVGRMLTAALARDFTVEAVTTTRDALAETRRQTHVAFVVNVGQKVDDALTFVAEVRQGGDERVIIAMANLLRRDLPARCYEAGADGCVSKTGPMVRELTAVLRRLLKRRPHAFVARPRTDGMLLPSRPFRFGGGVITPATMVIRFPRRAGAIDLNPKEVGILHCFARRRGRLLRRAEILARVWGPSARNDSRSLDTYLTRLRQVYRRGGVDLKRIVRSKSKVGWRVLKT